MKRVLFSMVLLMAVSFSFAQMKNVKEAKSMANDVKPNFKQAEQLIKEAMKNPETKDLADTWDVAGFIQRRINEEQMKNAFLKKPYDTLKVYNSILKMYEYYNKCDELAEIPNEKGKVKNKYRKANASSMLAERPNLINGGIQYFNLDKNKEALKFFATYVESASYPMLADKELAKNDTLLPQIAYYATLAADRVGDKDAIIKYAPMALSDKDGGKFAMQLMADAYKAKGDTAAWIKSLEEGILKFPGNDYFFANLVDYYNSSNQASKAMEFADRMLANDPNNKLYLYVKAYLYHNMKEYDNAIEYYKKAIAADPEYAEAYSNVGLVYLMKAQDYADKATTDINDPKYAEAQAVVKKFYEEAKPFYEKARALKPDQQDLWLQGLYRVYYNLNMGPEFEEIDKMMKEAEKNKEADNKKKEVADAKNDAEQVVFMTEKALKDLGEKVTDSDKKEAEDLMEETKKAIETEDVEKINKAKDKLLEKANALATKVYEEAAKNNQSAESAKTETKEEKKEDKDDTVVDAEYEEK